MWDDATLHRLREAIEMYVPMEWRGREEVDDEALGRVLTATFLGARPFHLEPDDVVVVRMPAEAATAAMVQSVGQQVRQAFPDHRAIVMLSGTTLDAIAAGDVVTIARCPEHGLHGCRTECFECGGPVEQVPMIAATEVT